MPELTVQTKKKNPLKHTLSILSYIVMGVIIFCALALLVVKLAGGGAYVITSGSMEPNYPIGSVVVAVPVPFDKLCVDDVVSFKHSEGVATHRIISLDAENKTIQTKGDANDTPDGDDIPFEDVIGRVRVCVPGIGRPLLWLKGVFGK